MANKKKKVMVAMSGGVDSSTAAFLLQKRGYEIIGVFMRLDESHAQAEAAARQVCNQLGIKFYPINLAPIFKKEIINYFIDSYRKGLTPNPCAQCNKLIKFGELLRVADELGCDFLATGHYIKNQKSKIKNQNYRLLKPEDKIKDQTYFLHNLTQVQLKKILFPLGEYKKEDIKKIAEREGLKNLKGESQDVCFLNINGQIAEHNEYLKKYIKANPGPIKTLDNKTIGEHQGLYFYTLGQRKGIEIGGTGPYYAVKMDQENNVLYVSSDHDDPELYKKELIATEVNWIAGVAPKMPFECEAVIRYRHKPIQCKITNYELSIDKYKVEFKKSQRAVTPGQSVVFYKGDELLGGGIIS